MAKIYAPNKQYNGVSASVTFAKGVGETNNPTLLSWFKDRGYTVEEEDKKDNPLKHFGIEMSVEQLKAYAIEHGIDIGQSSSVNGILKKITDAEKESGSKEGEEANKEE